MPYNLKKEDGLKEKIQFLNATTVSLSISRKELDDLGIAKSARYVRHRPSLKEVIVESGIDNPDVYAEKKEIASKMDALIDTLEDDEKDIIYRRIFRGHTFQEIADAKRMTWRAVDYHFRRSLEKLKTRCKRVGLDIYAS
jgi:DNA-directed RNA polymerase sigma subunit (sigma70/sigma32)